VGQGMTCPGFLVKLFPSFFPCPGSCHCTICLMVVTFADMLGANTLSKLESGHVDGQEQDEDLKDDPVYQLDPSVRLSTGFTRKLQDGELITKFLFIYF
jgi:hypothetical protein